MPTPQELLDLRDRTIEVATGKTVDELRRIPIDEQRAAIEEERGRPIQYTSYWPDIGRGSIHHDMLSHQDVDKMFQRAIRGK